jgi:hypothetical protein
MSIYHMHHIIPRHMGGTDDPSNLVKLTVEEHAEAHRILYEQHGLTQDLCAWKGLSGQIGKEEIIYLLGQEALFKKQNCPLCDRTISRHNMSRHLYSCSDGTMGTKANHTRTGIKINNPGWKNRQYVNGSREKSRCITDGTETRRIKMSQEIPPGWTPGRHYKPRG